MKKIMIAPSVLSADFSCLADEIRDVEEAGCDLIHVDVMDGHFVPNLTIGPLVVSAVRKVTKLPLDVHLMLDNPSHYVTAFRKAGADWITVHVEAEKDARGALKMIRDSGAKAGLSLRPKTPVEDLFPYLPDLDLILVMSVEPGFGGQLFMPDMMEKIEALRSQFPGLISVDGGIDPSSAPLAVTAGADVLVAGNSIFGKKNRAQAMAQLRDSCKNLS